MIFDPVIEALKKIKCTLYIQSKNELFACMKNLLFNLDVSNSPSRLFCSGISDIEIVPQVSVTSQGDACLGSACSSNSVCVRDNSTTLRYTCPCRLGYRGENCGTSK